MSEAEELLNKINIAILDAPTQSGAIDDEVARLHDSLLTQIAEHNEDYLVDHDIPTE